MATVPTVGLVFGHEHDLTDAIPVVGLAAYALVLGAAVLTYLHWRLTAAHKSDTIERRLTEWLMVGLTLGAVNGFLQLTSVGSADDLVPVAAQLALTFTLCVVAVISERVDVPAEPGLTCIVAGLVLTGVFSVGLRAAPSVELSGATASLANGTVLVAGLVLAQIVLNRTKVSLWARRRVATGAVLLTGAQCAANLGTDHDVLLTLAVVAFALGALTLCSMAYQMLRSSLAQQQAELAQLQRTLADVRSAVYEDRALLHEVGATLAGITTASRVMRGEKSVPAHRRKRLETMLSAELARLERLMANRAVGPTASEDQEMWVDDVVQPIVVSHQERQLKVFWSPCRKEAYGDPDELAEICNVLLENAARHAPGAAVWLSVDVADDEVVVVCSDEGRGVPPQLRDTIFEPEVKGAGSPGQGLGLAIVQRLAQGRGGSVELADLSRPGATFVARLPRRVETDAAAGHVA